jgi:hypothetical protein
MFAAYDWRIPIGEWFDLPHSQRAGMVATVVARNLIDNALMKDAETKRNA